MCLSRQTFPAIPILALAFGLGLAHDYKADAYVISVVPATEFMLAGPETYVAAKEATRRDLLELSDELSRSHSYVEGKDYHLYLLEGRCSPGSAGFCPRA